MQISITLASANNRGGSDKRNGTENSQNNNHRNYNSSVNNPYFEENFSDKFRRLKNACFSLGGGRGKRKRNAGSHDRNSSGNIGALSRLCRGSVCYGAGSDFDSSFAQLPTNHDVKELIKGPKPCLFPEVAKTANVGLSNQKNATKTCNLPDINGKIKRCNVQDAPACEFGSQGLSVRRTLREFPICGVTQPLHELQASLDELSRSVKTTYGRDALPQPEVSFMRNKEPRKKLPGFGERSSKRINAKYKDCRQNERVTHIRNGRFRKSPVSNSPSRESEEHESSYDDSNGDDEHDCENDENSDREIVENRGVPLKTKPPHLGRNQEMRRRNIYKRSSKGPDQSNSNDLSFILRKDIGSPDNEAQNKLGKLTAKMAAAGVFFDDFEVMPPVNASMNYGDSGSSDESNDDTQQSDHDTLSDSDGAEHGVDRKHQDGDKAARTTNRHPDTPLQDKKREVIPTEIGREESGQGDSKMLTNNISSSVRRRFNPLLDCMDEVYVRPSEEISTFSSTKNKCNEGGKNNVQRSKSPSEHIKNQTISGKKSVTKQEMKEGNTNFNMADNIDVTKVEHGSVTGCKTNDARENKNYDAKVNACLEKNSPSTDPQVVPGTRGTTAVTESYINSKDIKSNRKVRFEDAGDLNNHAVSPTSTNIYVRNTDDEPTRETHVARETSLTSLNDLVNSKLLAKESGQVHNKKISSTQTVLSSSASHENRQSWADQNCEDSSCVAEVCSNGSSTSAISNTSSVTLSCCKDEDGESEGDTSANFDPDDTSDDDCVEAGSCEDVSVRESDRSYYEGERSGYVSVSSDEGGEHGDESGAEAEEGEGEEEEEEEEDEEEVNRECYTHCDDEEETSEVDKQEECKQEKEINEYPNNQNKGITQNGPESNICQNIDQSGVNNETISGEINRHGALSESNLVQEYKTIATEVANDILGPAPVVSRTRNKKKTPPTINDNLSIHDHETSPIESSQNIEQRSSTGPVDVEQAAKGASSVKQNHEFIDKVSETSTHFPSVIQRQELCEKNVNKNAVLYQDNDRRRNASSRMKEREEQQKVCSNTYQNMCDNSKRNEVGNDNFQHKLTHAKEEDEKLRSNLTTPLSESERLNEMANQVATGVQTQKSPKSQFRSFEDPEDNPHDCDSQQATSKDYASHKTDKTSDRYAAPDTRVDTTSFVESGGVAQSNRKTNTAGPHNTRLDKTGCVTAQDTAHVTITNTKTSDESGTSSVKRNPSLTKSNSETTDPALVSNSLHCPNNSPDESDSQYCNFTLSKQVDQQTSSDTVCENSGESGITPGDLEDAASIGVDLARPCGNNITMRPYLTEHDYIQVSESLSRTTSCGPINVPSFLASYVEGRHRKPNNNGKTNAVNKTKQNDKVTASGSNSECFFAQVSGSKINFSKKPKAPIKRTIMPLKTHFPKLNTHPHHGASDCDHRKPNISRSADKKSPSKNTANPWLTPKTCKKHSPTSLDSSKTGFVVGPGCKINQRKSTVGEINTSPGAKRGVHLPSLTQTKSKVTPEAVRKDKRSSVKQPDLRKESCGLGPWKTRKDHSNSALSNSSGQTPDNAKGRAQENRTKHTENTAIRDEHAQAHKPRNVTNNNTSSKATNALECQKGVCASSMSHSIVNEMNQTREIDNDRNNESSRVVKIKSRIPIRKLSTESTGINSENINNSAIDDPEGGENGVSDSEFASDNFQYVCEEESPLNTCNWPGDEVRHQADTESASQHLDVEQTTQPLVACEQSKQEEYDNFTEVSSMASQAIDDNRVENQSESYGGTLIKERMDSVNQKCSESDCSANITVCVSEKDDISIQISVSSKSNTTLISPTTEVSAVVSSNGVSSAALAGDAGGDTDVDCPPSVVENWSNIVSRATSHSVGRSSDGVERNVTSNNIQQQQSRPGSLVLESCSSILSKNSCGKNSTGCGSNPRVATENVSKVESCENSAKSVPGKRSMTFSEIRRLAQTACDSDSGDDENDNLVCKEDDSTSVTKGCELRNKTYTGLSFKDDSDSSAGSKVVKKSLNILEQDDSCENIALRKHDNLRNAESRGSNASKDIKSHNFQASIAEKGTHSPKDVSRPSLISTASYSEIKTRALERVRPIKAKMMAVSQQLPSQTETQMLFNTVATTTKSTLIEATESFTATQYPDFTVLEEESEHIAAQSYECHSRYTSNSDDIQLSHKCVMVNDDTEDKTSAVNEMGDLECEVDVTTSEKDVNNSMMIRPQNSETCARDVKSLDGKETQFEFAETTTKSVSKKNKPRSRIPVNQRKEETVINGKLLPKNIVLVLKSKDGKAMGATKARLDYKHKDKPKVSEKTANVSSLTDTTSGDNNVAVEILTDKLLPVSSSGSSDVFADDEGDAQETRTNSNREDEAEIKLESRSRRSTSRIPRPIQGNDKRASINKEKQDICRQTKAGSPKSSYLEIQKRKQNLMAKSSPKKIMKENSKIEHAKRVGKKQSNVNQQKDSKEPKQNQNSRRNISKAKQNKQNSLNVSNQDSKPTNQNSHRCAPFQRLVVEGGKGKEQDCVVNREKPQAQVRNDKKPRRDNSRNVKHAQTKKGHDRDNSPTKYRRLTRPTVEVEVTDVRGDLMARCDLFSSDSSRSGHTENRKANTEELTPHMNEVKSQKASLLTENRVSKAKVKEKSQLSSLGKETKAESNIIKDGEAKTRAGRPKVVRSSRPGSKNKRNVKQTNSVPALKKSQTLTYGSNKLKDGGLVDETKKVVEQVKALSPEGGHVLIENKITDEHNNGNTKCSNNSDLCKPIHEGDCLNNVEHVIKYNLNSPRKDETTNYVLNVDDKLMQICSKNIQPDNTPLSPNLDKIGDSATCNEKSCKPDQECHEMNVPENNQGDTTARKTTPPSCLIKHPKSNSPQRSTKLQPDTPQLTKSPPACLREKPVKPRGATFDKFALTSVESAAVSENKFIDGNALSNPSTHRYSVVASPDCTKTTGEDRGETSTRVEEVIPHDGLENECPNTSRAVEHIQQQAEDTNLSEKQTEPKDAESKYSTTTSSSLDSHKKHEFTNNRIQTPVEGTTEETVTVLPTPAQRQREDATFTIESWSSSQNNTSNTCSSSQLLPKDAEILPYPKITGGAFGKDVESANKSSDNPVGNIHYNTRVPELWNVTPNTTLSVDATMKNIPTLHTEMVSASLNNTQCDVSLKDSQPNISQNKSQAKTHDDAVRVCDEFQTSQIDRAYDLLVKKPFAAIMKKLPQRHTNSRVKTELSCTPRKGSITLAVLDGESSEAGASGGFDFNIHGDCGDPSYSFTGGEFGDDPYSYINGERSSSRSTVSSQYADSDCSYESSDNVADTISTHPFTQSKEDNGQQRGDIHPGGGESYRRDDDHEHDDNDSGDKLRVRFEFEEDLCDDIPNKNYNVTAFTNNLDNEVNSVDDPLTDNGGTNQNTNGKVNVTSSFLNELCQQLEEHQPLQEDDNVTTTPKHVHTARPETQTSQTTPSDVSLCDDLDQEYSSCLLAADNSTDTEPGARAPSTTAPDVKPSPRAPSELLANEQEKATDGDKPYNKTSRRSHNKREITTQPDYVSSVVERELPPLSNRQAGLPHRQKVKRHY